MITMSIQPPRTDDDYDDMLHALGRPKKFTADTETYRNNYCCATDSLTARRFDQLGWWTKTRYINHGRDAVYQVNGAGKQALAEWMQRRA